MLRNLLQTLFGRGNGVGKCAGEKRSSAKEEAVYLARSAETGSHG